jgi:hypothetical protein
MFPRGPQVAGHEGVAAGSGAVSLRTLTVLNDERVPLVQILQEV